MFDGSGSGGAEERAAAAEEEEEEEEEARWETKNSVYSITARFQQ